MLEALQDNALFVCGIAALAVAAILFCATLSIIRRAGGFPGSSGRSCSGGAARSAGAGHAHAGSFLRSVDQAGDEALILYDKSAHRVACSSAVERVLGIDSRALETDVEAFARAVAHDSLLDLREALEGWNGASPFEAEFSFSDEAVARITPETPDVPRWGVLRVVPCGEGKVLVSVRDITSSHNMRCELVEQRERAESGERAKLMFLSNMSHEIRTPMNGIMGTLSLAKLHLNDASLMEGYLTQADDLLKYLLSVINDVLDISKIDNDKLEIERRCFDLTNVIRSEQSIFGEMIAAKGISFEVSVDPLPTPYVLGDELRLTQVITNLLSNSQKFTNPGGTITLSLRCMQVSDGVLHVAFVESDTGKGMSPEFLVDLFNPFSQEDRSISRRFGGTGLGMAITDQLTRLMGGQISVESEVGVGTTFEIHLGLPIASEEEVAAYLASGEVSVSELTPDNGGFKLAGSTILLAEDNVLNASIAIDMLEELGAQVEHAADGVAACEIFERSEPDHFDVVLMDVQMPNRNGWEAAQYIRALSRPDAQTTPIFALSADAYMEDKRHSREVGMNGHISKPVEFEQLEHLINAELAMSMQRGVMHV
ncbi:MULTISPECIES: ATP-binding protein [unclassified Adlercreutzia]|uniref:ATP-binding protein n=1 Tax=unclassified Adlercreutzia TaxID=2636013 RepID=UPI0013E9D178|nr:MULTISPECIES: ATP-binding protein [unclassified Adlercreutzia]